MMESRELEMMGIQKFAGVEERERERGV